MQIEKIIKSERQRQGLSQYGLAKKAGLNTTTLVAIEAKGNRLINVNRLLKSLNCTLVVNAPDGRTYKID